MLYPKTIEQKLGFDKIREIILDACITPLGRKAASKLKFSNHFELIYQKIKQTAEFQRIIQTESNFPQLGFTDSTAVLARAAIEGSFIEESDFFDLKISLSVLQQIISFFKNKHDYPVLLELMHQALQEKALTGWATTIALIQSVIDERGKVKDTASSALYEIRKKLAAEQNNVKRILDRIYRTAKNSGWIGEDMSLSVRNGRLVLPLIAEHKRKLSGFVHDESASGNIAFVEPGEVIETNNEIRDLEIKERKELIRILEQLTSEIRPEIPQIKHAFSFLGLIDFIRAKAIFSIRIGASAPDLVAEPALAWTQAVYPLLYLSHIKLNKPVVPLQLQLDPKNRVLIVSGPNAGGKSVLLKTIGLVQYMAQCGLPTPISPDSKVGLFSKIFIDIGDDQSIENDLSTYSSHLSNMLFFLKNTDNQSLFLIDEFGTGTDPALGGAIAEAILEDLTKSKAFGVVNTHYTNLKLFADKHEGLINGAMKFDAEHLEPLYELEIGKPGSSFAIEVAQKIGLPHSIINRAKRKIGYQQVSFEKLIKELEIEKKTFVDQNLHLHKEITELKDRSEKYQALKEFLENDRKRILNEAKNQAKQLLDKANKEIEYTIREIKEKEAQKIETKKLRQNLIDFEQKELKIEETVLKNTPQIEEDLISIGDYVRIIGQNTLGRITGLKGKEVEIQIGELKSKVKIQRIEKISRKEFREANKESIHENLKGFDINEKASQFSFNLDLRGKRSDEALIAVDQLLDDAILIGYSSLRIVHGKGNGILRNLIRNHLKQYKQIKSVADEHPDRGGAGVTLIELH